MSKHLDKLLDDAGIDVLVATSKHNVQYLLGDYKFFFFEAMDAIGVSRYLPAVVYQKGKPETAAYVGNSMEAYEKELGKFWPQSLISPRGATHETMQRVVEHIAKLGPGVRRVGIEAAFLPADAEKALRRGLSNVDIVDAFFPLERLRAVKSPKEIEYLQLASERVIESMNVVYALAAPGKTKQELAEALRVEEVKRGLAFDYCLIAAGTSLNRAPSEQKLLAGDVALDRLRRQLPRLHRRPGPHGRRRQQARRRARGPARFRRGGADGVAQADPARRARRLDLRVGEKLLAASPHKAYTHFMAHGMGLVSHEAPRLMDGGPVPYPGYDIDRPLEAGMVLSIETTMNHPKRGLVKIEDTVLVTDSGWKGLGDGVRGWQRTAG